MKHIEQLIESKTKIFSKELAILASMLATDWSKLPVDTLLIVGDTLEDMIGTKVTKRYFYTTVKTQSAVFIEVFMDGATSKTTDKSRTYRFAIVDNEQD